MDELSTQRALVYGGTRWVREVVSVADSTKLKGVEFVELRCFAGQVGVRARGCLICRLSSLHGSRDEGTPYRVPVSLRQQSYS